MTLGRFLRRAMMPAVVMLTATAIDASAQSTEFSGTTTGCFYTTTVCTPTNGDQVMYLKYVSGQFDQKTANGVAAIGSGPQTAASNLGFFGLGASPSLYFGDRFLLQVLFTTPFLTGPTAVYTAALLGTVTNDANGVGGGVQVKFGNTQTFAFDGPDYAGTFTLKVNSLSVSPGTLESGTLVPVTGYITTNITGPSVTATPEPATLGLLATGLLGLVPMIRRRRTE